MKFLYRGSGSIAMLLFALQSSNALAHHSRAEFSRDVQVLEGELVSVKWANPHPTFSVNIVNNAGVEELWQIQGFGSIYTLSRGGVSGDLFTLGQRVKLAGQPSTKRNMVFLVNNLLLENGAEIVLNGGAGPYWNEESIGGRSNWAVTENDLVDAAVENQGIFRVWSEPDRGARGGGEEPATRRVHLPYNDDALARRATWDPLDDPDMQCVPKGMPAVMTTPHPFTFSEAGSNIRILANEYSVERIIHIGDTEDPEQQPRTRLGYSVGHWEGDTLVVVTSRINESNYFYFGHWIIGLTEIVERIRLSEDQSRLDYSAVFTAPDTFTEPARIDRYWVALGETPEPHECVVAG